MKLWKRKPLCRGVWGASGAIRVCGHWGIMGRRSAAVTQMKPMTQIRTDSLKMGLQRLEQAFRLRRRALKHNDGNMRAELYIIHRSTQIQIIRRETSPQPVHLKIPSQWSSDHYCAISFLQSAESDCVTSLILNRSLRLWKLIGWDMSLINKRWILYEYDPKQLTVRLMNYIKSVS